MYIVIYSLSHLADDDTGPIVTDHWEAHEHPDDADKAYAALLDRDDVYTASKCAVLESTDYEPTERS